uniref:Uncharacterized protein n=1 Tax=Chromera velia CCMP2878 TaxID=1169474 RepID=A0A0G4GUV3_9ALVE|eukprot:Cvel_5246.t1-p1 / transcript=Cvel_5246.t1 / gene=Cvel_5246 / organism=Chromera_velia_CCMP2878 / gene_product=hypothetical protein / transcript_product=hypothetical protein / location=Cvel_scaffold241:106643-108539(+) / protein_length=432 / sequence_SO=supercontig / SO=protein_coding / is_pseudo=false
MLDHRANSLEALQPSRGKPEEMMTSGKQESEGGGVASLLRLMAETFGVKLNSVKDRVRKVQKLMNAEKKLRTVIRGDSPPDETPKKTTNDKTESDKATPASPKQKAESNTPTPPARSMPQNDTEATPQDSPASSSSSKSSIRKPKRRMHAFPLTAPFKPLERSSTGSASFSCERDASRWYLGHALRDPSKVTPRQREVKRDEAKTRAASMCKITKITDEKELYDCVDPAFHYYIKQRKPDEFLEAESLAVALCKNHPYPTVEFERLRKIHDAMMKMSFTPKSAEGVALNLALEHSDLNPDCLGEEADKLTDQPTIEAGDVTKVLNKCKTVCKETLAAALASCTECGMSADESKDRAAALCRETPLIRSSCVLEGFEFAKTQKLPREEALHWAEGLCSARPGIDIECLREKFAQEVASGLKRFAEKKSVAECA